MTGTQTAGDPKEVREKVAPQVVAEAKRKLDPGGCGPPAPGDARYGEAGELFLEAANIYGDEREFDEAVDALAEASDAFLKCRDVRRAAEACLLAHNFVQRSGDMYGGVEFVLKAADIWADAGEFSLAGKHRKEAANLYENDKDTEKALEIYKQAADALSKSECGSASASECLWRAAQLSTETKDYTAAIEIFKKADAMAMATPLQCRADTKGWSPARSMLKVGLCHLALGDLGSVHRTLDGYEDSIAFGRDIERMFLEDLLSACEACNVDAFRAALVMFDRVTPLDRYDTLTLSRIARGPLFERTVGEE